MLQTPKTLDPMSLKTLDPMFLKTLDPMPLKTCCLELRLLRGFPVLCLRVLPVHVSCRATWCCLCMSVHVLHAVLHVHVQGHLVLSVHVSACASDWEETNHLLKYASLATKISMVVGQRAGQGVAAGGALLRCAGCYSRTP